MFTPKRLIGSSLFMFLLIVIALAQDNRLQVDNAQGPVTAAPLVTATATAQRVRFVSPGTVVQLRLEVYNETGQKLFDTELRGGNVLDWLVQDGAGERLAAGSYACVLTIKSLSGRVSQRVGLVTVNDEKTVVEAAGTAQLSLAQQQAISPVGGHVAGSVEGRGAFTVLQESEAEAITAVTHDGTDGQMTRTRGALSFRVGDFFAGQDEEQMRLTEAGNLGIGTDSPQAKLDVAGVIRTSKGIEFANGTDGSKVTKLTTTATGSLQQTLADGTVVENATGTGTQNKLAKWTDNAGTLGNSVVTEATGKLGIGTASPNYEITLFGNDVGLQLISPVTGTTAADGLRFGIDSTNKAFLWNQEATDMYFGTSATERMRIRANGNIGIGTTTPAAKLDVVGNINTSSQLNIGGQPALRSFPASGNLFAGVNAGLNTAGLVFGNAFFGTSAGLANTSGVSNAFFGTSAGDTNRTGDFNTMIGSGADVGSTNLNNATAIGQRALVTLSDSLVLGSINGQNGATTNTNVGIGTTAPSARLHVRDNNGNILFGHAGCSSGFVGIGFGANLSGCNNYSLLGNGTDTILSRPTSGTLSFREGNTTQMSIVPGGNVGIGTTSPGQKLEVSNGVVLSSGSSGGRLTANNPNNQSASVNLDWFNDTARIRYGGTGVGATNGFLIQGPGDLTKLQVFNNGLVTIGTLGETDANLHVFGKIFLADVGTGGSGQLCYNTNPGDSFNAISFCSSSLRYKTDVRSFTPGLDLLNRLRPVSFRWRGSGSADLGLVAEEVERVEPLLVTYKEGEVEGVKYDRLGVVLLNAVQEQQAQIKQQQQLLSAKDARIAALEARFATYETRLATLKKSFRRHTTHHPRRRAAR